MIYILYSRLNDNLCLQKKKYFGQLPVSLQSRSMQFKFLRDQQRFIMGKLLLIKGLNKFNISSEILSEIQYNEFGRPFIKADIDFNISHSGEYIVLAIAQNIKLGIDIEKIIPVDFSNFENIMTKKEWLIIHKFQNPYDAFFNLWTTKESVIKADGRGLSISMQNIMIYKNEAICDSRKWFIYEIDIDQKYKTHLSSNIETKMIRLEYVDFNYTNNMGISSPRQ